MKFTLTYRPDRKGLNTLIQNTDALYVFGEAGVQKQSMTPRAEEIEQAAPAAAAPK